MLYFVQPDEEEESAEDEEEEEFDENASDESEVRKGRERGKK